MSEFQLLDEDGGITVAAALDDVNQTVDFIRYLIVGLEFERRDSYTRVWNTLHEQWCQSQYLARFSPQDDGKQQLFPVWLSQRLSPSSLDKFLHYLELGNAAQENASPSARGLGNDVAQAAGIVSVRLLILSFGDWVANSEAALEWCAAWLEARGGLDSFYALYNVVVRNRRRRLDALHDLPVPELVYDRWVTNFDGAIRGLPPLLAFSSADFHTPRHLADETQKDVDKHSMAEEEHPVTHESQASGESVGAICGLPPQLAFSSPVFDTLSDLSDIVDETEKDVDKHSIAEEEHPITHQSQASGESVVPGRKDEKVEDEALAEHDVKVGYGAKIALQTSISRIKPLVPQHENESLGRVDESSPYFSAQDNEATAMTIPATPRSSHGEERDTVPFTRADLRCTENGERLNDSCIDTYVESLVIPSQLPGGCVEAWPRRSLDSSPRGAEGFELRFGSFKPDSVSLDMTYCVLESESPTPKASLINAGENNILQWGCTIVCHNYHWTTMIVRMPRFPPGPKVARAKILVCDSAHHNIRWHENSLKQLAVLVAHALAGDVAAGGGYRSDDSSASKDALTVNIQFDCRMAQMCPRQPDGVDSGPIACLLLARFCQNPVQVYDRLSSPLHPLGISGTQARNHVHLHLKQHLALVESVARLHEMKQQALLFDVEAEDWRDRSAPSGPEEVSAPEPIVEYIKALRQALVCKRRTEDLKTLCERKRADLVTKCQRLHDSLDIVASLVQREAA